MKNQIEHIVITANGKGTRMAKYEAPKFMLPYKGKPIIHHLLQRFPSAIVLTHHDLAGLPRYVCGPTDSRKDTLRYLEGWKKVLVLDSDIIVKGEVLPKHDSDCLYMRGGINAGLYFIKDISTTLSKMEGDDISAAMHKPQIAECETLHMGTVEEYEHHCS